MRYSILFLFFVAIHTRMYAQVIERHGLIRYNKPGYSLSTDDSWLMVDEITEKNERFSVFLNLKDWSVKTSRLLGDSKMLPDLKGAVSNFVGSYQGAGDWVACKKFCSYYYPDLVNGVAVRQWPDRNYLLGLMPGGTFLASDDFVTETLPFSRTVIKGLKTIEPMTGNTIKTIQESIVIGRNLSEYNSESKVIGNGSVLMWNKDNRNFITVPLATGKPVVFDTRAPVTSFSGVLGVAVDCVFASYGPNNQSIYNNRQLIYDMSTGKVVLDTVYRNQKGVIYCGTSQDGQIHTFDAASGELKEQVFKNNALATISQKKLELPDIKLYGNTQGYELIISRKEARVLMVPIYWKRLGQTANELYAWNLNTGKMVFKIKDFFYPYDSFLAQQEKQKEADRIRYSTPVVQNTYKPQAGTMVKASDGYSYVLVSFNASTKIWDVIKLQKDRKGNYERSYTTKPDGLFSLISGTKCSYCAGSGAISIVRDQNSSTVDNYNARLPGGKVITTTISQVQSSAVCTQCHGAGFIHGN